MNPPPDSPLGKVYLVGAGPGDPRLITLRGAECLAQADLVLYDCKVNPTILDHASPAVETVCLDRRNAKGSRQGLSQERINALLVDAARQGKAVVYLKRGDPHVFEHGAQEIEALAAAGIPHEIVPGITAALAAAGYAGIPITHGEYSSAVAMVTGQEQSEKSAPPLDYGALAEFPGTLIFYIGAATAAQWSRALIDRGKPADTPVAIISRCTWSDQQTIRCTLAALPKVIAERDLGEPAVIVIGQVAALGEEVSWFAAKELFATRILLTRPHDQTARLAERLMELGAEVMLQPAIQITDPPDWAPVDDALDRLDRYQWLVFSSANGVRYLLDRLLGRGGDLRRLGRARLAAIGPATAEALRRYHLQADLIPQQYRAEALAEELISRCLPQSPEDEDRQRCAGVSSTITSAKPCRFLLVRASRGREVLAQRLSDAGGDVEQVVVYSSTDTETADPDVAAALSAGRIDWITVTSSAIARSLVALFGDDLRQSRLASISPITSEVLRRLGHQPAVEAAEYTVDGLVEAIVNCGRRL